MPSNKERGSESTVDTNQSLSVEESLAAGFLGSADETAENDQESELDIVFYGPSEYKW